MDWMSLTEKEVMDTEGHECMSQLVMLKDKQIADYQRRKKEQLKAKMEANKNKK